MVPPLLRTSSRHKEKKTRHPFRAAHLNNGLHWPEIDPQVQRARADHGLQVPFVQRILNPIAQVFSD